MTLSRLHPLPVEIARGNEVFVIDLSLLLNKTGIPWTENEHKRFLLGLQKVGKGDLKGISRKFVKSRTPTQVASHAQKYFLRRTNLNRRRRRSSLFDITTETVTEIPMEQDEVHYISSQPETNVSSGHKVLQVFPEVAVPISTESAPQTFNPDDSFQTKPAFNLNTDTAMQAPLALNLSLASSFNLNEHSNSRHSAFAMIPSLSDGDNNSSIIRVA